ncbi:MAG: hypothetical protein IPJ75_01425 [Ignavibacteriales bacterium]|nr:hypothetical protein [Ignavibacteriales bacterium]
MKYLITILLSALPLLAQDFIPFSEKMTPEWQKKIKAAGVINEREYVVEKNLEPNSYQYYVASVYDANGKLQSVSQKLRIDDHPGDYYYTWNSEGKLSEIFYSWKGNDGSKVKHKYEFTYDAGKLSYVALYDLTNGGSGAMRQWNYEYSNKGALARIVSKVFSHSESGEFSVMGTYEYDAKGRLSTFSSEFHKTTFSYTKDGKLDKKVLESSDIKITEKYDYDKAGNLVKISNTGDAASIFDEIKNNNSGLPILKKSLIKVHDLDDEIVEIHYSYTK